MHLRAVAVPASGRAAPPYGVLLQNSCSSPFRRATHDDLVLGLEGILTLSRRPSVFVLGDVHGWQVRGRPATPLDALQVLDVFLPPEVAYVVVNDFMFLPPTVLRRFEVLVWSKRPTFLERLETVKILKACLADPAAVFARLCAATPALTRRAPAAREHTLKTAAARASCVATALCSRRLCVWQRNHDLDWLYTALLPVAGHLGVASVDNKGRSRLLSVPDHRRVPRERSEKAYAAVTALTDCVIVEPHGRRKFCVWSAGQRTTLTRAGLRRWSLPHDAPAWWSWTSGILLAARRLTCLCAPCCLRRRT